MTSYTPRQGETFALSADELAHLQRMTDEEIEAGALADPDNLPLDEARLERMVLGRAARIPSGKIQTLLVESQRSPRIAR